MAVTTPSKPATVKCAAEIAREAVTKALYGTRRSYNDTGNDLVYDARRIAYLAATYALSEQQKDFSAQLAELRAECESKRREWRDRKLPESGGGETK
jgi:hypothetical protein